MIARLLRLLKASPRSFTIKWLAMRIRARVQKRAVPTGRRHQYSRDEELIVLHHSKMLALLGRPSIIVTTVSLLVNTVVEANICPASSLPANSEWYGISCSHQDGSTLLQSSINDQMWFVAAKQMNSYTVDQAKDDYHIGLPDQKFWNDLVSTESGKNAIKFYHVSDPP